VNADGHARAARVEPAAHRSRAAAGAVVQADLVALVVPITLPLPSPPWRDKVA
jgi:hypothetical protein